jgi:integrase
MPHLRRWRRFSTQYVVEYDGKPIASQLRRAWGGARKLAGLSADCTPHVLRHSCATLLLQNGVSTWRVARLLGTSEQVIQRTYGHHCIEDLREAVGVWSTAKNPPETREQARQTPSKLTKNAEQSRAVGESVPFTRERS